ncbi:hypothetical protein BGX21_009452 [Mortierella sp. AD011]|nr:hypothetical protein BGX20_005526 [Mortierella sp. AD010]KAF9396679.1 hypothetical protein BGX21_009452 [Mortierella sp. AD011]
METEYLDIVNKEILEIELFFKELYSPSSCPSSIRLSASYTPRLLPLIKPSQNEGTSHSINGYTVSEADNVAEERFVADLRERYKQLKVVQDQLHVELTRLRIWKLTTQPQQDASESANAKAEPKKLKDMSTEMPIETTTSATTTATAVSTPKSTQPFKWVDILFICLIVVLLRVTVFGPLFGETNGGMRSSHARSSYTYPWPRS